MPVQARAHLEIVEDVVGVVEVGEGLGVDGEVDGQRGHHEHDAEKSELLPRGAAQLG